MNTIEYINDDGSVGTLSVFDVIADDYNTKDREEEEVQDEVNEWIKTNDLFIPALNTKTFKTLPAGFYSARIDNSGPSVKALSIELDEVYRLPREEHNKLLSEINTFWDKSEVYEKYNFIHKRGVLLQGPPGTGKTSIINLMTKDLIDSGGLVFYIKSIRELNDTVILVNDYLRQFEPERPTITIIEDIDGLVNQNESLVLAFLDGEDQINHNVTVATTNRVHELNDLLLRPSRFDLVIEVDAPDYDVRYFYFKEKGIDDILLSDYAKLTEGMSMAHLKEVFICTVLLGYTIEDTIDKLTTQDESIKVFAGKRKTKRVGF